MSTLIALAILCSVWGLLWFWHVRAMKRLEKPPYRYPSAVNKKLMSDELAASTEQMN